MNDLYCLNTGYDDFHFLPVPSVSGKINSAVTQVLYIRTLSA